MTEKMTREQLVAALANLDERDRKNDADMAPFRAISMKIEEEREALLEANETHIEGKCFCGELVLTGDRHSRTEDGEIMCLECSPTWAEVVENLSEAVADGDDDCAESLAISREKVAAGLGDQKVC